MEATVVLTTKHDLEAAVSGGTVLETGDIIAEGFNIDNPYYSERSLIEVNGVVYWFLARMDSVLANKVTIFVMLSVEPEPEPPAIPVADFTCNSPGNTIELGAYTTFSAIDPVDASDTISWKAALDGEALVEWSNSVSGIDQESDKFTPIAAGTYTIELTLTNVSGTDTETKVSFLEVTEP